MNMPCPRIAAGLLAGLLAALLAGSAFADGAPASAPAAKLAVPPGVKIAPKLLDAKTGLPDLDKICEHLDDLFRSDSSIGRARLVVTKPRRTRTMVLKLWTQGTDKALVVIDQPRRDAGTATLRVGQNLWNYLPRISRTIRIPPSMMLQSWMGTDFTNDDLVRESSYRDDFDAKLVGFRADAAGWQVDLTAKADTVGLWRKIEFLVSPDASLPVQAKYYDRKGRLARVMEFKDVKVLDGRRLPTHLVLRPIDKKGHLTEMFYEDFDFDAKVPAHTFSLSRLERSR